MTNEERRKRRKSIAKRFEQVQDIGEVAREYGVSHQTVREACRVYGVRIPRQPKAEPCGSFRILATLQVDSGTYRDVGNKLGVSYQRIHQVAVAAREHGVILHGRYR